MIGFQEVWLRKGMVALTLACALVYGLVVPLGEAPDEPGHYNYARILAAEQRLPRAEEEHEAFQPPLLYALAAPLVGLGDVEQLPLLANADFTLEPGGPSFLLVHTAAERFPYAGWAAGWHLMRALSAVLAAVTAFACFQTAMLLSGGLPAAGVIAVAGLALMPQFSLVHGAATNDSLAVALGSLLVYRSVGLVRRPARRRRLLAIGVIWGLAILAKVSLLAAGLGLAAAIWAGRRGRRAWPRVRESVRDLIALGAGAGIVSGPWFALNTIRYGHPLAWELVEGTNAVREGAIAWLSDLTGLYRSYWLSYVGMGLPSWFYVVSLAATVLVLALALRGWARAGSPALRTSTPVLLLWALGFFVSWVRWAMAVMGTDQARLLYPAAAALVPLIGSGAALGMGRRWRDAATPLLTATMLVVNVYGLAEGINPVFPLTRMGDDPTARSSATVVFDERLELVGWRIDDGGEAGDPPRLWAWWRSLRPLPATSWLTVRVLDGQGNLVSWRRGVPDGGAYAPDCWPAGVVVTGARAIPLPDEVAPGRYRLEAGVQTLGEDSWWPVTVDGTPSGEFVELGELLVTGSQ